MNNAMSILTAGLTGASPDGSVVNEEEIRRAMWNIRHETYQSSVFRTIISDIVDPGWEMHITLGSERYEFSESEKKNQKEVLHNFAHECFMHLLAIGFVVVGSDTRGGGVRVPFVVSTEYMKVYFIDSPFAARRYWVESKDASHSVLEVTLYVLDKPDEYGHLTSIGSQLLNDARRSTRALMDHEKAAHDSSQPTWVMQNNGKGLPRRAITDEDEAVDGELDAMYEEHAYKQAALDVNSVDQMVAVKQHQHQNNMRLLQRDNAYADLSVGITHLPPSSNNFVAPTGIAVVGGPSPQFDPHLIETLDRVDRRVLTAFKMPPSLMDASRSSARFSSQSDVGITNYFRMIENRQNQLGMLLKDAYVHTCGDVFGIFVESIVRASLDIPLDRKESKSDSSASGQSSRRQDDGPPGASSAEDDDSDEQDEASQADSDDEQTRAAAATRGSGTEEIELPKLKKLPNGDSQLQETAQSVKRAAVIARVPAAQISELEREVRAGISLEIMFNRRALIDQKDVVTMYEKMMLSHDKASVIMAAMSGIPHSFMLTEVDLEAEARRRKKIADLLTPESEKPPKPVAPGASASASAASPNPKSPSTRSDRPLDTDSESSDDTDDSASADASSKRKNATNTSARKRTAATRRRRGSDTD